MSAPFERFYYRRLGDDWSWETTETTFRVSPDLRIRQRHWRTKMSRAGEPHRLLRFDDPLRWQDSGFVRITRSGELIPLQPTEVAHLRAVVDEAIGAIGEEALAEDVRLAIEAGFLEPDC